MTKLHPRTVLQRVPDLKLEIDSSNCVRVLSRNDAIPCGSRGLAVLDAFAQPTSLREALARLRPQIMGAQDWMDLMDSVIQLHRAGILRDETQQRPTLRADGRGFDAAPIHARMLNDRQRTSSFLAAIREVVRPGDVVLDLGTGTGILAVAAARAGARHVYAIEAGHIGKSAQAVFEANGLADRITMVSGWSNQLSLPERANVLVSEIIGHQALGERVLEMTRDAQQRLLEPDARMVPRAVKLFGLPVTIPSAELTRRTFTAEALHNWQSWYHIDLNPLADAAKGSPHTFYAEPHIVRNWNALSEPVLLADVDLRAIGGLAIDNTRTVTACSDGRLDGLAEYFELDLGPTTRLSTHPAQADGDCSWRNPVWVFGAPLSLQAGSRFAVSYRYRVGRPHSLVSVSPA